MTHIPQSQFAIQRSREEKAIVFRVKGDGCDEIKMLRDTSSGMSAIDASGSSSDTYLESTKALFLRNVPQSHGLVH